MKDPPKLLRHEQDSRCNLKQELPRQGQIEVARESRKYIICTGFSVVLSLAFLKQVKFAWEYSLLFTVLKL